MGVNGRLPELVGGADKLYGLSNLDAFFVEIDTGTLVFV